MMVKYPKRYTILMADDDAEDCLLVQEAMAEADRHHELRFVRDGEELFDYLQHSGKYTDDGEAPLPDLILLDMKMPKKDGREVLQEIKSDPRFKRIPVVALTTSTAADDVGFSYEVGVNSYITKPATFRELVDLVSTLTKYWFELAELPTIE